MVKVTYKHQPGDPDTTEWRGQNFKSGEAIDIDGRTKEGKEHIEAAKGNPWFDVDDGKDGGNGGSEKPAKDPNKPETAEEYRAYALGWLKTSKSSKEVETRWKAEEPMRSKVGWGTEDQDLLDPLMKPRLEQMKRAEAAQN